MVASDDEGFVVEPKAAAFAEGFLGGVEVGAEGDGGVEAFWHIDMTSVWVAEHGWVYLNAIIDRCTREIVGWELSDCAATQSRRSASANAPSASRASSRGRSYWASTGKPRVLTTDRIDCVRTVPRGVGHAGQRAVKPPSTTKLAPVTQLLSSDARNSASDATSSTVPILPNITRSVWIRRKFVSASA